MQPAGKGNPEKEQAVLRLAIGSLVFLYLFFFTYAGMFETATMRLLTVFIVFASCMLISTIVHPAKSPTRRLVGLAADITTTAYGMYLNDVIGAPLWVILLWTVFGNGIRYGKTYLVLSTFYASLCFAIVIYKNPYWYSQPVLSYGLLIGLVALPAFIATLLERLNKAIEHAEEANRAKNRFIANMSHEMRTPLHGIMGTTDLLEGTPLTAEQKELSKTIHASARTLLSLVNDVLDISRIEEGKGRENKVDFDFHALLKTVASMVAPIAHSKGITLRTICSPAIPFRLRGDDTYLQQVLLNLLGNAAKFTEEGEICLLAEKTRETATTVTLRVEVSDTGIGIPFEVQASIFNRFAQADESITRKYGGSGLGTTIAKQLVELMGGEIGVHSEPGKGSTFWFTLEIEKQPASASPETEPDALSGTRMLVVSSDGQCSDILKTHLTSWNVDVGVAEKASQAFSPLISAANDGKPFHGAFIVEKDLDMDPFELAKALRSVRMLKNLHLILVSREDKEPDPTFIAKHGFAAAVGASIPKTILFHTVHFLRSAESEKQTVTSLSSRYRWGGETESSGLRILVAEDNPTNRIVITKLLERMGHAVQIVENGAKAVETLRKDRFDIVFMDLNMPVMGGLEATRICRSEEAGGSRMTIVALTADATSATKNACLEAGMDACMTKPFNGKTLSDLIGSLVPETKGTDPKVALDSTPRGRQTGLKSDGGKQAVNAEVLDELEAYGGKGDFVKNLVWIFLRDSEKAIGRMEAAAAGRNIREFCDLAHSLKGTAGQIGAIRVMEICERLQHMKEESSVIARQELFAELKEEIARVKKVMIRRISKTG